jgi:hypothetical protein
VSCALLVAYQDVFERKVGQRVIGRQDCPTGVAKYDFATFLTNGVPQNLCACSFHDLFSLKKQLLVIGF